VIVCVFVWVGVCGFVCVFVCVCVCACGHACLCVCVSQNLMAEPHIFLHAAPPLRPKAIEESVCVCVRVSVRQG